MHIIVYTMSVNLGNFECGAIRIIPYLHDFCYTTCIFAVLAGVLHSYQ